MKLISKKDFSLNGIIYTKGDEVKVETKEQLIRLNERGFIEPLTQKQIQNFGKEEPKIKEEIKPKFENKKEEE